MADVDRIESPRIPVAHFAWVFAVAATVWAIFFWANFHALTAPDSLKYAQAARNFLRGDGFAIEMRHASDFALYADGDRMERIAVAHRFGYFIAPAWTALWFALLGEEDWVAAFATGWWYVLAVPLMFALAREIAPRSAWLATLFFALHAGVLALSVSGLTEPAYLAGVIASMYGLARARRDFAGVLVAAVALAVTWYTRDLARVFVGVALVGAPFLISPGKVKRWATLIVLTCVMVAALGQVEQRLNRVTYPPGTRGGHLDVAAELRSLEPAPTRLGRWLDRYGRMTVTQFTEAFPGHSRERTLDPVRESDVYGRDPGLIRRKWATNLRLTMRHIFIGAFGPVLVLAFLGFAAFARKADGGARIFYGWSLVVLAAHAAVCVLMLSMSRYLLAALPLACVFAAEFVARVREAWKGTAPIVRDASVGALAFACLYPFSFATLVPQLAPLAGDEVRELREVSPEALVAFEEFLKTNTTRDEVVVCDVPWVSMWRGDRTSIWLPLNPEQLIVLARRVDVDAVVITFQTREDMSAWREWLRGFAEAPGGARDGWRIAAALRQGPTTVYLLRPDDMSGTP
ncbi:MAG: hypothetical protein IT350_08745 [Deltaproteobacteria bacterium]|nr:hypothetical protein [Deltaproteobacteria bacterium]